MYVIMNPDLPELYLVLLSMEWQYAIQICREVTEFQE